MRGAVELETSRKRLGDLHHPPPRSPWWPTSSSYSIAVSTDSSVQFPALWSRIMFACGFSSLGSSYFAFNDLAAGAVGCLIIISGNGNPLEIHSSDKGACCVSPRLAASPFSSRVPMIGNHRTVGAHSRTKSDTKHIMTDMSNIFRHHNFTPMNRI